MKQRLLFTLKLLIDWAALAGFLCIALPVALLLIMHLAAFLEFDASFAILPFDLASTLLPDEIPRVEGVEARVVRGMLSILIVSAVVGLVMAVAFTLRRRHAEKRSESA